MKLIPFRSYQNRVKRTRMERLHFPFSAASISENRLRYATSLTVIRSGATNKTTTKSFPTGRARTSSFILGIGTRTARSRPFAPGFDNSSKTASTCNFSGSGSDEKWLNLSTCRVSQRKRLRYSDDWHRVLPSLSVAPGTPYNRSMPRFYERADLVAARRQWRQEGRKVVFTNGCYDILHPGHIRLLERARNHGDILILALNTDSSVQRLKGPKRPFLSEQQRAQIALSLEAVDAVTLFDEDTPRELIAAVLPDVLIKGADWSHFIAGREEVEAAGGQVLALSLEPGYSTTNIVDQIVQRQP